MSAKMKHMEVVDLLSISFVVFFSFLEVKIRKKNVRVKA